MKDLARRCEKKNPNFWTFAPIAARFSLRGRVLDIWDTWQELGQPLELQAGSSSKEVRLLCRNCIYGKQFGVK